MKKYTKKQKINIIKDSDAMYGNNSYQDLKLSHFFQTLCLLASDISLSFYDFDPDNDLLNIIQFFIENNLENETIYDESLEENNIPNYQVTSCSFIIISSTNSSNKNSERKKDNDKKTDKSSKSKIKKLN